MRGPQELLQLFPRAQLVGAQFGVVLVDGVEIATFRSDHAYADGRHPERVTFETDPKQDALRRDFTINALLLDPSALSSSYSLSPSSPLYSQVLDYVGGLADLRAGDYSSNRRSGAALRRGSSADAAGGALRGAPGLRNRARRLGGDPEAARARFYEFRRNGFAMNWFGF